MTAAGDGRIDPEELERLQRFLNVKPFFELSFITVIAFAAFKLTRPNGFQANEYALVVMVVAGMTIGRSLLGIGEGFSTDFLWVVLPGTLIGFAAYGFARSGRSAL